MKRVHSALRTDINITPLIDIVLVLLIVFIVMVPAFAHAHRALATGQGTGGPLPDLPRISVVGAGRYLWGAEDLGRDALVQRLAMALASRPVPERRVVLRIPADMPLHTASEAMDLVALAAGRVGDAKDVRTVLQEAH